MELPIYRKFTHIGSHFYEKLFAVESTPGVWAIPKILNGTPNEIEYLFDFTISSTSPVKHLFLLEE